MLGHLWRAGCAERCMSGSEGDGWKRATIEGRPKGMNSSGNALAVYPTQLIGVRIPAPQPFSKPSLSMRLAGCPAASRQ